MSRPLRHFPARSATAAPAGAPRRAFSLVEMLVAMAIAGVFFSAVFVSFLMILRSSNDVEIQTAAVSNARAALESLSIDLTQADNLTAGWHFIGANVPLAYGDGTDNNRNGLKDEELGDGKPYPANTTSTLHSGPTVLRRAVLCDWTTLTLTERPEQSTAGHYGDQGVGEDCVFNHDSVEFLVHPSTSAPYFVTYQIQTFHDSPADVTGTPNVLTRTTTLLTSTTGITSPIAYDVLSFNCLYWDASLTPPDWAVTWNDAAAGGSLPKSVLIEITIYADSKPIETYHAGDPVRTVTLRTAVNPSPPKPSDVTGAVAHWRFDEAGGMIAHDSSGGGHTATLFGMNPATAWVPGHIGGAVRLAGAGQYIAADAMADYLGGSNDFSVSIWMAPDPGNPPIANLLAAGDPPLTAGVGASTIWIQNGWYGYVRPYGGSGWFIEDAPAIVATSSWHHYALVKNGVSLTQYVDGVLSGQGDMTAGGPGMEAGPWQVFFGDMPDPLNHAPYNGLIDDVRIFNRALTPGEVTTLAQQ